MNLEQLTAIDVVVYALYRLGGWERRVHTEDIALECFKIAPSKFSWVKHPQYPDLTPARFALEKLKTSRNSLGSMVQGESERKTATGIGGWRLTPLGVAWVDANKDRVERALQVNIAPRERLQGEKKLKALIKSKAYEKFCLSRSDEITHSELSEALLATINTSASVLQDRIQQLEAIAVQLKNNDASNFLNFAREKLLTILEGE